MNKKTFSKALLSFLLMLITVVACNKQNTILPDGNEQSLRKARTETLLCNILYSENADNGTLFNGVTKQTSTTYGITADSTLSFDGTKSARFELRDTDAMVQNGTRAEVTYGADTTHDRWFGFALYMPSTSWQYDNQDEVIMQWHQGGGATPALCL